MTQTNRSHFEQAPDRRTWRNTSPALRALLGAAERAATADEARAADLAATHGISTDSARRIVAETPARVAAVFAQAPKDEPW